MPVRPHHPATGAGSRQRPSTAPSSISPSPAGSLAATRPWQTFGSEVSYQGLVPESDREDDRPSHSGQPSPDGLLEPREREDSVGLLSPPSSQPSPIASVFGSRNGGATSLARITGAFRSRSRSWNTSSGSVQAAAGAHDTIHRFQSFQYLMRCLRSVVPARTVFLYVMRTNTT